MKKIVEVHQISDWTPESDNHINELKKNRIKDVFDSILELRDKFGSTNIVSRIIEMKNALGLANKYGTPEQTYNALFYLNQVTQVWFKYTTHHDQPVQIQLLNKTINTVGKLTEGNKQEIGSSVLLPGIWAAMILRDKEALAFYAQIPLEFTGQWPFEDMIWETLHIFYQVLMDGRVDQNAAVASYHHIREQFDWEVFRKYVIKDEFMSDYVWKDIMHPWRIQLSEYIYLPVLTIYHQILNNDQENFEIAVYQALVKWKEYYTLQYVDQNGEERDHSLEPDGYLALPILAACTYGYDQGMELTKVSSPYIPEWMIKGDFANRLLS